MIRAAGKADPRTSQLFAGERVALNEVLRSASMRGCDKAYATCGSRDADAFVTVKLPLHVRLNFDWFAPSGYARVRNVRADFNVMADADGARQVIRELLIVALPGVVRNEIHLDVQFLRG